MLSTKCHFKRQTICCQTSSFAQFLQPKLAPKEGFLIGAHHGLELSDVDRVCELLIMQPSLNFTGFGGLLGCPRKLVNG